MTTGIGITIIMLGGVCWATAFASPSTQPAKAALGQPHTYLLNGKSLAETRRRTLAADPGLAEAVLQVRRKADKHMSGELWTVTGKTIVAPSGDKHDYVSLLSYHWPNPDTPDGLPYVYRDGQLNPEVRQYDRYRLIPMCEAVEVLSLAYYLTGEEKYAKRAADQLRAWFLDERTKMNPHLRYGAMRKGSNEGTNNGPIQTVDLTRVVDAVGLLEGSASWPPEDHKRLQAWFAEYLQWLLTSDLGKREGKSPQNHGTYYDMQTADFALFVGKNELAKEIIEGVKTKRIATQIEPDGSQPLELKRESSLHYSNYNLTGMFNLARLGEHVGVDLWSFQTADGRSIRRALDWMIPYATGEKPWEYKQIKKFSFAQTVYCLRQAAIAYKDPAYEQAVSRMKEVQGEVARINLLYPPSPPPAQPATDASPGR